MRSSVINGNKAQGSEFASGWMNLRAPPLCISSGALGVRPCRPGAPTRRFRVRNIRLSQFANILEPRLTASRFARNGKRRATNLCVMSQRKRKLVLVWAVIAMMAVIGVIVYSWSQPPLPALPNPNGYDDFVAAARLTTREVSDFADLTNDSLRSLVSTNAESLRLIRLGLSRQCVLPTHEVITNFGSAGVPLFYLRRLACLLAADGKLAATERRPGDAAKSYAQAVKFGNGISRGGVIINRLVGAACEAIGLERLARLSPSLNCDEAKEAIAILEHVEQDRVEWGQILQAENRFARWAIPHENLLELPKGLWEAHKTRKAAELMHKQAVAHARLMTAQLALNCYRSDRACAPGRLDELVPRYLQRVPQDPFRAAPLVYRPQGTNWLLYSVGADGVDHGGKRAQKDSIAGDMFYDSRWWTSPRIVP